MIHVLMVDDDPMILEITKIFLERYGDITVDTLDSAVVATNKLETDSYDVIISDYVMPEMDGLAFLKAVREKHPFLPFILFTGKSREEVVIEALNNGADYYLQKEGDPKSLYAELSHQVHQAAEREKTKKALEESERSYRSFVQNFQGIAFRYKTDLAPIFVHGQVEQITGYTKDELLSSAQFLLEIIHPEDRPKLAESLEKLRTIPNYSTNRSYRIIHKNGDIRWIYERVQNISDDSGVPLEIEGAAHDITERKISREQIVSQRDLALKLAGSIKLDKALENCLNTGMKVSGMDCGTIYLIDEDSNNVVLAHSAGLSKEFVEFLSCRRLNPKKSVIVMVGTPLYIRCQDRGLLHQRTREREGIRAMAVLPLVHGDHVIGYYSVGSHSIDEVPSTCHNALETIGAMTGNAIARIQAIDKLHENERELQTLFDSLQDIIFVLNSDGRILRVNKAAEERLGYEHRDLLGKSGSQLNPPNERHDFSELIEMATTKGEMLWTGYLQAKDGTKMPVETNVAPGRWGDQDVIFGICRDVSERKVAEEKLNNSQKRFQDIIDFLPDATFVIDEEKRVTEWNRAIEEMTNVRKEEILGKGDYAYGEPFYKFNRPILIDLIFSSDEEVTSLYTNVRRKGHTVCGESKALHPIKNEVTWLWGTASPLFDKDGNIVGAIESIRDITELKRAEMALRKSEEKFRTLFENAGDPIFISSLDGRMLEANQIACDSLDLSRDELLNMSLEDVEAPEDISTIQDRIQEIFQKGHIIFERRHKKRDGSTFPVEVSARIIEYAEDKAILGIARNISDRKRAEQELYESERRYRSLAELSPEAIVIHHEGEIVYINPVGLKLIGAKSFEEIKKKPIMDYIHPDFKDLVRDRIKKGYDKRKPSEFIEEKFLRLDGEAIDVEVASVPINDGGKQASFVVIRDITERKMMENALKENEENLQAIFKAAENVSFIITDARDPEPTVLEFSPGAENIFGYKKEEVVGKKVSLLHLPEDVAKFPVTHRQMREESMGFCGTSTLVRKSGEKFPAIFSTYPLRDRNGEMYAALGVSIDITEQRKMEEELRKERAKFQALSDNAPFGMAIIDEDGTFEYVNTKFKDIFGYDLKDVPNGKEWFRKAYPDPEYRHKVIATWLEDLKHFGAFGKMRRTFNVSCKYGRKAKISFLTVKLPSGQYLITCEDITEQRRAEEALKESEERQKLAIEGANLGVWDWDVKTGVVIRNKEYAAILGYRLKKMGQDIEDWWQQIHPDDQEAMKEIVQSLFDGKLPYIETEYRMRSKDGQWIWVHTRGRITDQDENGHPLRVTGIIQDITETKRYQDAIKEANRKLNLLSSITRHDLMNQITGLSGYSQLLSEILPQDPVMQKYMNQIIELIRSIRSQVEFTRDYQNMGVKNPRWQNVESVAKSAAKSQISEGLDIQINTGSLEVFADPMLEKVFANILENVERHSDGATWIRIYFQESADKSTIFVENDGAGIPKNMKNRIFEQAFGKHTGYGLFLVKEILGITGIGIKETGDESQGARFEMEIPKEYYRIGSKGRVRTDES